MASQIRQTLRQNQSTVMTQKLQQAIKLLQMSSTEITGVIQTEVEKNPFLEFEEVPADESGAEGPSVRVDNSGVVEKEKPAAQNPKQDNRYADIFDLEAGRSGGVSAPMPRSRWQSGGGDGGPPGNGEGPEMRVAAGITLRDHLQEQLGLSVRNEDHLLIGQDLIDTLDDAGYLAEPVEEIAERLNCNITEIEEALGVMQTLDPPGVFARSLAECLALQLKERDRLDPAMEMLIDNLDALADGKHAWLAEKCGVDREDLLDMLEELRTLDPRPGLVFDTVYVETLIPDVFVGKNDEGEWIVELNPELIPRILIDRDYYANENIWD